MRIGKSIGWLLGSLLIVLPGCILLLPDWFPGQEKDPIKKVMPLFDAVVEHNFQQSLVPGAAVGVVYNDQVIYSRCLGVRKAGASEAVDADTLFQIASVSKSFNSSLIATLVQDDLMNWDDKVVQYWPEFQMYDPWVTHELTIRDCLSHRCGLPKYAGDELVPMFGYDQAEVYARMKYHKPVTGFRTTFAYQNIIYALTGELASRRTGKDWPALVTQRIFQPLGMTRSVATLADYEKEENRAYPHCLDDEVMTVVEPWCDDLVPGAGAVSSTLSDMIRWVRMQLNEGNLDGRTVVKRELLQETHSPETLISTTDSGVLSYGMGWMINAAGGHLAVFHGGDYLGVSAMVYLMPKEKVGVVILTNAYPTGNIYARSLYKTLDDLVVKGTCEKDWWADSVEAAEAAAAEAAESEKTIVLPDPPSPVVPGLEPAVYAGEYQNDFYGTVRIAVAGEGLQIYYGKNPVPTPLSHWNEHTYKDTSTGTGVIFRLGSDHQPAEMEVVVLGLDGRDGHFTRVDP